MKREPKRLEQSEIDYLLSLTASSLNRKTLTEMFANKKNKLAMFRVNDKFSFDLRKFEQMVNPFKIVDKSEIIQTTVGRYIYNLYINDTNNPFFYKINGYVNQVLNSSEIESIDDKMSNALVEGKISSDMYISYLNRRDNIALFLINFIGPAMTINGMIPLKSVEAKKKELFEKNADAIKNGDVIIASKIEQELLAIAKTELKDDPIMGIYNSGARGGFASNYKNTSIMRGAIFSTDGKRRVRISTGNLISGIPREDLAFYNDIGLESFYSKGVETQKGGYVAKQLAAAFQGMVLDEAGTDCRTKKTVQIKIDSSNYKKFLLRYAVDKGSLVLLTSEVINSYLDKFVDLRTPLYCSSEKLCSKCAGELYYNLGIKNIGLIFNIVGTTLLNLSMKKFHDMSIKVATIDPNSALMEI